MTNALNIGVYRWINTTNGMSYIGSSKNLRKRKAEHIRKLVANRHENPKFQNAWNKYGETSFKFELLALCNESDLLWHEQLALNAFDAVKQGYNIAIKAGAPMRGRKTSVATKLKISKAFKGRVLSSEHRRKISEAGRGKKNSPESRLKMSRARRGRPMTSTQKTSLEIGWKHASSPEGKLLRSRASKHSWQTEERRTKAQKYFKGKFKAALAKYLDNPVYCVVCNTPIMPKQETTVSVNRLYGRISCSRACANKARSLEI